MGFRTVKEEEEELGYCSLHFIRKHCVLSWSRRSRRPDPKEFHLSLRYINVALLWEFQLRSTIRSPYKPTEEMASRDFPESVASVMVLTGGERSSITEHLAN